MVGSRSIIPRRSWRDAFREIPWLWFLGYAVFVLTLPIWAPPLIYFFMWSFLADRHAVFAWVLTCVLVGVAIWGMVSFFVKMLQVARVRSALRKLAEAGDEEALAQYLALRSGAVRMIGMWRFTAFAVAAHLLIPIAAALALWAGMQAPDSVVGPSGGSGISTPKQALQRQLAAMRKRGVFRPVSLE